MNTVTFTCEIITPMFLAGADGATPEIRPQSIKGALRFWWRALHGHLPIEELRKKEAEIFGGGGENGRKSRISLRRSDLSLKIPKKLSSLIRISDKEDLNLYKYLAYGAEEREFYDAGEFKITFIYDKSISVIDDILNPFQLISFFGGLGARSRNGFGRFYIKSISSQPEIKYDVSSAPDIFIRPFIKGNVANYTAFSKDSILYKTDQSSSDWNNIFELLGNIYATERKKLEKPGTYNKRAYIATPIIQSKTDWHHERHAKPYFLSVTKNSQRQYDGWILFLPCNHYKNDNKESYEKSTEDFNKKLKSHLNLAY